MKFKYIYKILSLVSAFISGGLITEGIYTTGVLIGVSGVVLMIVDSKQ